MGDSSSGSRSVSRFVSVGDPVGAQGLLDEFGERRGAALGETATVLGTGPGGQGVEDLQERLRVDPVPDAALQRQRPVAAPPQVQLVPAATAGPAVVVGGDPVRVEGGEQPVRGALQPPRGQLPRPVGQQCLGEGLGLDVHPVDGGDPAHRGPHDPDLAVPEQPRAGGPGRGRQPGRHRVPGEPDPGGQLRGVLHHLAGFPDVEVPQLLDHAQGVAEPDFPRDTRPVDLGDPLELAVPRPAHGDDVGPGGGEHHLRATRTSRTAPAVHGSIIDATPDNRASNRESAEPDGPTRPFPWVKILISVPDHGTPAVVRHRPSDRVMPRPPPRTL